MLQQRAVYAAVSHPKKGIHIFTVAEGADAFHQANNFSSPCIRQHPNILYGAILRTTYVRRRYRTYLLSPLTDDKPVL